MISLNIPLLTWTVIAVIMAVLVAVRLFSAIHSSRRTVSPRLVTLRTRHHKSNGIS